MADLDVWNEVMTRFGGALEVDLDLLKKSIVLDLFFPHLPKEVKIDLFRRETGFRVPDRFSYLIGILLKT